MDESSVTPDSFMKMHEHFERDIALMRTTLSELAVVEELHQVGTHARRAQVEPDNVLPELVDMISSLGKNLQEHAAMEEKYYPELAQCCGAGAEKSAQELISEHGPLLREMADMRNRAEALAKLKASPTRRERALAKFARDMETFLSTAENHAEREDEFLFLISHNI